MKRICSILVLTVCPLVGCSDPAQQTASASLNLSVGSARIEGTACTTAGFTASISDPAPDMALDLHGELVDDGNGADVKCEVKGSEEVTFEGTIKGNDPFDNAPFTFSIRGALGADGTGEGSITIFSRETQSLASNVPCTFSGVTVNDEPQYGDGLAWVRFKCPELGRAGVPSVACASEGVVVFENCER